MVTVRCIRGVVVSLSRHSGYEDWLLQRLSSVVLVAYIGLLLGFWATHVGQLTSAMWYGFLFTPAMRVLGVLAAVSLTVHAMIGSWVVMTDYIKIAWLQYGLIVMFNVVIIASSIATVVILLK